MLDAEELLVVGLVALHFQPELGEVILQLVQGRLQVLHLNSVLLARLAEIPFQRRDLQREQKERYQWKSNPKSVL